MDGIKLFAREIPFAGYDPREIRDRVARGERLPLRHVEIPADIRTLLEQCWDQDPDLRPMFPEITQRLRQYVPYVSNLARISLEGDCLEDLLKK